MLQYYLELYTLYIKYIDLHSPCHLYHQVTQDLEKAHVASPLFGGGGQVACTSGFDKSSVKTISVSGST